MAADAIALAGRPRLAPGPAAAEAIDRFRAALAARGIVRVGNNCTTRIPRTAAPWDIRLVLRQIAITVGAVE